MASVLYVDDDRHLCQIVAKALRGEGYEVRIAFDGDHAIEQIREETPDLLLLDVLLPRRDGFDVLQEIRSMPPPAGQLPCLLVTGCTPTPSYGQRANALGAAALLTKPLPLDRLIEVVVEQLGEAKPEPAAVASPRPAPRVRTGRGISGTLDRIPFPAILHHLHGLRASGVLEVETDKKKKWIQLRDGYPVSVRSNLIRETLGHQLVRSGRITRDAFEESRRRMEAGGRQGEILVAMEVLSEEEMTQALREQADEKLYEIFSWTRGRFRFKRQAQIARASAFALEESPANLILRGVRSRYPIERIDRYIALHGQRYVIHGESPFYRFQDIHIDPDEEALLRGLDGTQRLADFGREEERLRRTVFALLTAGLLELGGARGASSATQRTGPVREEAAPSPVPVPAATAAPAGTAGQTAMPASPARAPRPQSPRPVLQTREKTRVASQPARISRAEDPRVAQLGELAERLRACSLFEILEVEPTASDDDLRRAYERLSARMHPDRYSGSSQAVRDLAADVFGLVSDAYETLSDPRRRQEYLLDQKRIEREDKARQQAECALEAETEFRKGDAALRARAYETAVAHFGRALQLYPDEGDHHAHYGWALYLCHPGDASIVGEALEHVRRGVKLASQREKPYLFMGRLYKAVGRADVAEKMFARAVQIQPECVEALRELRLIHMRRAKSKGLIGRILRR